MAFAAVYLLLLAPPAAQASSPGLPAASPLQTPRDSADAFCGLHGVRKPHFVLADTAGSRHSLDRYGGRTLLVHFFATWCEPCRPEMQALERLIAREGSRAAFRVVAISVNEPDDRVRRFFEKTPVSFPILLDRDRAVAKAWGVEILPTTYVLDAGLLPRLLVERDLEWDRLDIAQALKSPELARNDPRDRCTQHTTDGKAMNKEDRP